MIFIVTVDTLSFKCKSQLYTALLVHSSTPVVKLHTCTVSPVRTVSGFPGIHVRFKNCMCMISPIITLFGYSYSLESTLLITEENIIEIFCLQ